VAVAVAVLMQEHPLQAQVELEEAVLEQKEQELLEMQTLAVAAVEVITQQTGQQVDQV
jgi:signal transduction histidine kinase